MEGDQVTHRSPATRKRIPKACEPCRYSKVRCNGERPCLRCQHLKKNCLFDDRARDSNDNKLQRLEEEVRRLKQCLVAQPTSPACLGGISDDFQGPLRQQQYELDVLPLNTAPLNTDNTVSTSHETIIGTTMTSSSQAVPMCTIVDGREHQDRAQSMASASSQYPLPASRKRKRLSFEVDNVKTLDFVAKGLISLEYARVCFDSFFSGCDCFVPIFDPTHDTLESVQSRSSILFNSICTIGCTVSDVAGSHIAQVLMFELKKWINVAIMSRQTHCLETVQALLVTACYSSDRSLLLSFATRMALDLELPEAYEDLVTRLVLRGPSEMQGDLARRIEDVMLMRKTRTWFGVLVLEHILRNDAGKLPGFTLKTEVRRCRTLLYHGITTNLDLRLFSQVELNSIRVRIQDSLSVSVDSEDTELQEVIRDAKIDLNIWYRDWQYIIESTPMTFTEKSSLLTNLETQKHWSETMAICKVVRSLGIENICGMTSDERNHLHMIKDSLNKHLKAMVRQPQNYLANFRYAMDFVWAKCAFSFLLLLKLNRLLPETEEYDNELLVQGTALLAELNKINPSGGSGASKLYLKLLNSSIEKYGRAIQEHGRQTTLGAPGPHLTSYSFWSSQDAQTDLDSFIPEQFIFEWDFPGLSLFSSSTSWDEFFDEFLLGSGGGWLSAFASQSGVSNHEETHHD